MATIELKRRSWLSRCFYAPRLFFKHLKGGATLRMAWLYTACFLGLVKKDKIDEYIKIIESQVNILMDFANTYGRELSRWETE